LKKTNITASSDMFLQWCVNWTQVNVDKSVQENAMASGTFVITEQENNGVNETVLKL